MASKPHIQMHGPGQTWVFRGLMLGVVIAIGYLTFEFGRIKGGYDVVDAARERGEYEDRIASLNDEIVALKQEVSLLETHRAIDREAYREVESNLLELESKILEQRDALAFYRGIVSPDDGKPGLRVQDLTLTRGEAEGEYNLRLVLVQAMQHDRKVSGDVNLSVDGIQGGVETSYSLADLLPQAADRDWPFAFRYFQHFERQLVLPDGFTPERIRVEVRSRTRTISSIEEDFPWPESQG